SARRPSFAVRESATGHPADSARPLSSRQEAEPRGKSLRMSSSQVESHGAKAYPPVIVHLAVREIGCSMAPLQAANLPEPATPQQANPPAQVLFVDLDGTLIATNLLCESLLLAVKQDPLCLLKLPSWLAQ